MVNVKTVINYPKDKIYVKSLDLKKNLLKYKNLDTPGIDKGVYTKCRDFTDLISSVPEEFKNLNLFNLNNDFIMAYNLNRYSLQIENILEKFISFSYVKKNLDKLQNDFEFRYNMFCENHTFWRTVCKEKFDMLPPATAVTFKDGIFIIDGNHRTIKYFKEEDFNLKFNILILKTHVNNLYDTKNHSPDLER